MKLTLLGTGTPWPSVERQGSANLVQIGAENILFDAGRGATTQLAAIGMHPRDIDYIFITHHHIDHIGNLDDLLISAWNDGRKKPIHVFGPKGTKAIVDLYLNQIYARDIQFRMIEAAHVNANLPNIRELVITHDIGVGDGHKTDLWRVVAGQVEHGHTLGLSHDDWPCFGYRLEAEGKVLTISGDTTDCAGVRQLAENADLLVQCCYLAEAEIVTPEKRMLAEHVFASARQAGQIAKGARVAKLVLTHLSPKSDKMLDAVLSEATEGHDIEVVLGADLMAFEI